MVIDTHVWIWWMTGAPELSPEAVRVLDEATPGLLIADITLWEVAMLVAKGRVELRRPLDAWLKIACQAVEVVPISVDVAAQVARMPESFHGDPADRLIVATALARGLPLITRDRRIIASGMVKIGDLPK